MDSHECGASFDDTEDEFRVWSAQFHSADSSLTAGETLKTIKQLLWLKANVSRELAALADSLAQLDALERAYRPLVEGFDRLTH